MKMERYKFNLLPWVALIVFLLIGIYLRFETAQSSLLNQWSVRDFDRAFNLVDGTYIPLAGPEANSGGRLPGPFLYFLLSIPLLIHYSYESIFFFNCLLNVGAIVGLFFILKKYIGLNVAVLSAIFLCIYLPMIGAVGFPINPSFLFIFITFYFWALLELVLNKNEKVIPLLVLIIVLGVQLHFSIITYILIPAILSFVFRIKPSVKTLLYSLIICVVCFSPFAFYKYNTFQGIDLGERTFKDHTWVSIALIPFMGHTLDGIFNMNGFWRLQLFPKPISWIYFLSLVIPFSYLLIKVVANIKTVGVGGYKKEVIFLIQFYIPALIFDIAQPFECKTPHSWYSFIFIIPHVILTALFLSTIYSKIKNSNFQRAVIFSGICLLLFMTLDTFSQTKTFKENVKGHLLSDNFRERYYIENKSLDALLTFFLKKLNLTPKEYYDHVYFEGGSGYIGGGTPWSYQKLKLLGNKIKYSRVLRNDQNPKPCFYIAHIGMMGSQQLNRFQFFVRDRGINIRKTYPIRMNDRKQFSVYEYYPVLKQSCYNNSFNNFIVDTEIRDLSIQANGIDKNKPRDLKNLIYEEVYNSKGTLESFHGTYVIYDKVLRSPFGLDILIYKKDTRYYLNSKLKIFYYFWTHWHLINVNLLFNIENKLKFGINILPPDLTLAGGVATFNDKWNREIRLPGDLKLEEGNFKIKVNWNAYKIISTLSGEPPREIIQMVRKNRGLDGKGNSLLIVE